ncbi:3-hydroxyanthranilate 3,4-dioxygenase isoform X2 [Salmo trutta]|uniref:3-hydroxyanthranilate 3,4-dioxygenase isoform X2 n=1 Tax=Salmo trutta TaxID=8032 RepID=UPI0011308981|nr:3-hydroxyanthranilate 3,4-dioxygenase-like isoform X2 [Salmo trutta]
MDCREWKRPFYHRCATNSYISAPSSDPPLPPETVGLVLERRRLHSKTDCLRYCVDDTTDILRGVYCENLRTQLVPVIQKGGLQTASDSLPLQRLSGKTASLPGPADTPSTCSGAQFETETMLYGLGQSEVCKRVTDVWLWQQEGFPPPPPPPPHVTLDGQEFPQSTGDSLLIPGHSQ